MKKLLLTVILGASTLASYGQGLIAVGNLFGTTFKSHIFGADPTNPYLSLTGNSSIGVPAGTTVYGGALLQGSGWDFGFYGGPTVAGDTGAGLALYTILNFRTATANVGPAGIASGSGVGVAIPTVPAGSTCDFQIRVWNNNGGTINDWATAYTAWQNGTIAAGESAVITSAPLGGGTTLTPNSTGWSSFNVYFIPVPEPSTIALAGLGAAGLLLFRRRK